MFRLQMCYKVCKDEAQRQREEVLRALLRAEPHQVCGHVTYLFHLYLFQTGNIFKNKIIGQVFNNQMQTHFPLKQILTMTAVANVPIRDNYLYVDKRNTVGNQGRTGYPRQGNGLAA